MSRLPANSSLRARSSAWRCCSSCRRWRIYALFVLYPLAMSLWGSFFAWRGLRMRDFAGLVNFLRLFFFPSACAAVRALWHNVAWFFGIMVLQNGLGLLFAYLLFLRGRGTAFLQSVFFFPAVLSPVIVGALWRLLLAPGGVVEWALNGLGLHHGQPDRARQQRPPRSWMLIAVDAWNWMGLPVLIYTAGLRQISAQIFEAARLDGAGGAPHAVFDRLAAAGAGDRHADHADLHQHLQPVRHRLRDAGRAGQSELSRPTRWSPISTGWRSGPRARSASPISAWRWRSARCCSCCSAPARW